MLTTYDKLTLFLFLFLHRWAVRLESWSGAYLGVGMPGLSQAVVQLFLWIFFFFFFFFFFF